VLPESDAASALQGLTEVSERTRQRIDAEVRRIVGEAHDEAIRLLTEHRQRLDSLAEALVREETLDQPQAYAAAGVPAAGRDGPGRAGPARRRVKTGSHRPALRARLLGRAEVTQHG
jgi:hypothetical protein